MLPALPGPVAEVIKIVQQAGGRAYVVGGALRDMLRGEAPQDWDVAATLPTQRLLALFPAARDIGGACGTVRVPLAGGRCEITPCRTEGAYADHRHPAQVAFVEDIYQDLARRDFTVNAMAYDGVELIDPYGGQADIAARRLRCVGQADVRFSEDALRVLRLYRFMAKLGYAPEEETRRAAEAHMKDVALLSAERVRGEVEQILLSQAPEVLQEPVRLGVLERYGLHGTHGLGPLAEIPAVLLVRWWALAVLCRADTDEVAVGFGFSKTDAAQLREYTKLYRLGRSLDAVDLKMKLRHSLVNYAPLASAFETLSADFAGEVPLYEALRASEEPYRLAQLAVNGDDLRLYGIRGKQCGAVLDELLKIVIKDPQMNERRSLLGLAPKLAELLY